MKSILAPQTLSVKKGASVIFVANIHKWNIANGSQGVVVGFSKGLPVVELKQSNHRVRVDAYCWKKVVNGRIVGEVAQLPLKLAWAMTIHKSQGMSLDSAEIDLSRSFTYGMGYVALSRLKSIEGLYLKGLNSRSLQLDPVVYAFDKSIKVQSENKIMNDKQQLLMALSSAGAHEYLIKLSLGVGDSKLAKLLEEQDAE